MLPRHVQDVSTDGRAGKKPADAQIPLGGQNDSGHPREYDGNRSEILGNTNDSTLRLSSNAVPSRMALTSSEALPFGFMVSPFAEASDSSRWLRRAPERCQECGAFRNLYIVIEIKTGRWACNFCGCVNSSEDVKSREAIESCRYGRLSPPSCGGCWVPIL